MERVISALLILVGLINFAPVFGVVSGQALSNAYGIAIPEGDLLILLRHRALLFGIVGALIVSSAFFRELQVAAMLAGMVSMCGFLVLAFGAEGYGEKIHSVVIADVAGTALLAVAIVLRVFYSNGT